jgi:hypothetical protein
MRRRLPSADETLRILAEKRSRPARKAPPNAGRALRPLLKSLDERFGQGPGALVARWREIVGEREAAVTEPVRLTKAGVLELRVRTSSATVIQHQAPEILARVNLFLGAGTVSKLRIIQGPVRTAPRGPTPAQAALARRRAPPLDAAAEARLAEGVAKAPETLKASLLKLGRAIEAASQRPRTRP